MKNITVLFLLSVLVISLHLLSAQAGDRFLVINDLNLTPNPFSPFSNYGIREDEKGMRISFTVDTHSTFVWITARIFNAKGQLIRTLKEWEPVYGDRIMRGPDEDLYEINLWWDGYSDFNRIANNGRYILHLHVSDTEARTFSTEKVVPFALIK